MLVVKSVNGDLRRLDRDRVRLAAADRPDIILIEDYVSRCRPLCVAGPGRRLRVTAPG